MGANTAIDLKELSSLKAELEELLQKREAIRAAQMRRMHDGSATRAKTTTSNANVDKVNERIVWLRAEISKAQGA